MPGRPARSALYQRARRDQWRAAGVDEKRSRLHAREVVGGHDAARGLHQPHVQRDDVAVREERVLARGGSVAVRPRPRQRRLARPHQHRHAERLAVVGNDAADAPVAVDAERLAAQRVADADLPCAGLERGHLLRDLAHRREDQPPRQLGRRVGRRARMLARRDDDAEPRAGVDVDVRVDAALADQPEIGQALEQGRADLRALADQHQRLGVAQPLRERIDVLHMIVPDRDLVAVELAKARQRPQRVVIVVEDGDFHVRRPAPAGVGWVSAATTVEALPGRRSRA